MFPAGEVPRIPSPWRIRNDDANIVIYHCATDQLSFKVCTPLEASIVPFLSGEFTWEDIVDAWSVAISEAGAVDADLRALFNRAIDGFGPKGRLIASEGEVSPSYSDDNRWMFPNFRGYRHPVARLERPIAVNLAITNRCVCDCAYCYAERKDTREASFDRLCALFDELAANGIYIVDIVGGDLFTRRDVVPILAEMTKRDFVFFLSTKSHISRQTADRLRDLGIGLADAAPHLRRVIQVSVDTLDEKTAEFLTGACRYVKRSTETITNLVAAGLAPRVKCVLTGVNADAPDHLVRYFFDLGVRDFHFVQYGRKLHRHQDALFLSQEQKFRIKDALERLERDFPGIRIEAQTDTDGGVPARKTREQWQERSICSGGRISMQIQPDGDVTLCDQIPHAEPYTLGNAFAAGVLGVWKSERIERFLYPEREPFEGSACRRCPDFDECHLWQGYCYRDSLFHYGSAFDAPPDCPRQTKTPIRTI